MKNERIDRIIDEIIDQYAFAFIEGYPHELVYDQDKVLLVDENKGDLILTEAFRSYSLNIFMKLFQKSG